jgi:hypothetical protein
VAQEGVVACRGLVGCLGLGEPRLGGAQRGPGGPGPGELGLAAGEGVEQRAMPARVEQAAVVVLAVDLDEVGGERAQGLGSDPAVVDEGACPAVGGDGAPQDQPLARVEARLGEHRLRRVAPRELEVGHHLAPLGAGAHEPCPAPPAEREGERVEQDRLARARLAGEHVEPGLEGHVHRLDQGEVADAQAAEHRRPGYCQRPRTTWR